MLTEANNLFKESFYGKRKKKKSEKVKKKSEKRWGKKNEVIRSCT